MRLSFSEGRAELSAALIEDARLHLKELAERRKAAQRGRFDDLIAAALEPRANREAFEASLMARARRADSRDLPFFLALALAEDENFRWWLRRPLAEMARRHPSLASQLPTPRVAH
jgi:hypothetical protein